MGSGRAVQWLVVALGAVSLGACQIIDGLSGPEGLTIRRFAAVPAEVMKGGSATLAWEVEGAETVELDNGVGTVPARGTRQVTPDWTTSYKLTARAGTASASSTLQVVVVTPTPSPTPTPTPTPNPSPTPTPTPSPTPSPEAGCGHRADPPRTCAVEIEEPTVLPAGQCITLNRLTADKPCPVAVGATRALRFQITARTSRTGLRWRRATYSEDVVDPFTGDVDRNGTTTVDVTDQVRAPSVTFEVVDGGAVLLRFTLRHD